MASATGKWVTVVNNSVTPPGASGIQYFSFNQPSVNSDGLVVFRGRAKGASGTGGTTGGEPLSGVWIKDMCSTNPQLVTVADRNTLVPSLNSNGVTFTETPSIPRIDINSNLVATRGNHQPVETVVLPDGSTTKAGTTGIYTFRSLLQTGINNLGNLVKFEFFDVPGQPAGTKFDVFPGSPSAANGKFIVFKGNFTLNGGKTGVYFRDISVESSPAFGIADVSTIIPGQTAGGTVTFGSTAPPSAANGQVVFTGLDNEQNPTMGGIYLAPLQDQPPLSTLVSIGANVPDVNGVALGDGSKFNAFGEGLSFDGRFVSFWGAWGDQKRDLILNCPTDGNKDLIAYCMANSPLPGGKTPVQVPVNQGIFVQDTLNHTTRMVARSGTGEQFQDFIYWVYSGRPPGTGGGDTEEGGDSEPPRWRASAFSAVDGNRGIVFKGSKTPGTGVPVSGIYGAALFQGTLPTVRKILEVGDVAAPIDPQAPANSTVASVGLEREAVRNGWFTLTASFLNAASESWAGVYVTYIPIFTSIPTGAPPVTP